jgi:hypothetical protein
MRPAGCVCGDIRLELALQSSDEAIYCTAGSLIIAGSVPLICFKTDYTSAASKYATWGFEH